MEFTAGTLTQQIPYYLTGDQRNGLLKALRDFPQNANYYLSSNNSDLLQGDGWTNLQARIFETGERASLLGMILSNTCDISSQNRREIPPNIIFAPLIPLAKYEDGLSKARISVEKIHQKMVAIKEQKVTSIFFLPAGNDLQEDYIVRLDQLYTTPAQLFWNDVRKQKKFTLSMFGFYLFVFKLSVHFCRFHESVSR